MEHKNEHKGNDQHKDEHEHKNEHEPEHDTHNPHTLPKVPENAGQDISTSFSVHHAKDTKDEWLHPHLIGKHAEAAINAGMTGAGAAGAGVGAITGAGQGFVGAATTVMKAKAKDDWVEGIKKEQETRRPRESKQEELKRGDHSLSGNPEDFDCKEEPHMFEGQGHMVFHKKGESFVLCPLKHPKH